jgi:ATP-dependent DNA ligase
MLPMPASEPFDSPSHCFEVAWEGVRTMVSVDRDGVRAWGRTLQDVTGRYPELTGLQDAIPPDSILDGELIVGDAEGRPDPSALADREHADRPDLIARAAERHPITYVVFDLLWLRGRSLLSEPLHRRRTALRTTVYTGGRLYVPEPIVGDGLAFFDAAQEKGLEGVLAKRLEGGYQPGRRHPDWLLIQAVRREDFAVLGFLPGRGPQLLEAIVVGSYTGAGFKPVGKIVGGYDAHAAFRLRRLLDALPPGPAPHDRRWVEEGMTWVKPSVVVAVRFSEWARGGVLRFPIFCGLRPDVAPQECVRIPVIEPPSPRSRRTLEIDLPRLPL